MAHSLRTSISSSDMSELEAMTASASHQSLTGVQNFITYLHDFRESFTELVATLVSASAAHPDAENKVSCC